MSSKLDFFKLQDIGGGKGLGMVALQDIEAGTVICVDLPLLVLDGGKIGMRDVCTATSRPDARLKLEAGPPHLRALFEQLPPADQTRVAELADCHETSTVGDADPDVRKMLLMVSQRATGLPEAHVEEVFSASSGVPAGKSVRGIFRTNAIPQGEHNAQGVYPIISRFNHSCLPNAIYQWREHLGTNVVVTTRFVKSGEELCVSYFKSLFMTRQERAQRTMMTWGWKCKCPACEFEVSPEIRDIHARLDQLSDAELDAIPAEKFDVLQKAFESCQRRQELWRLEQSIERAMSLQHGRRMLAQMKELFEAEGMLPNLVIECKLAWDELSLQTVYNCHDLAACRAATRKLYEVKVKLGGEESEEAKRSKAWMDSARGGPTPEALADSEA